MSQTLILFIVELLYHCNNFIFNNVEVDASNMSLKCRDRYNKRLEKEMVLKMNIWMKKYISASEFADARSEAKVKLKAVISQRVQPLSPNAANVSSQFLVQSTLYLQSEAGNVLHFPRDSHSHGVTGLVE